MENVVQVRNEYRKQQWIQIIQECQSSGLSNGAFQWPRSAQELRQLDARSFRWLMEGLKIDQPKAIQKGKIKDLL